MSSTEPDKPAGQPADATTDQPGSVAVVDELHDAEAASTEAVLASAPEAVANSLGEYTRLWLRRVRSGESGALPVILGLIAIGAYFQISQHAFLSAANIANLMGQAGWIIAIAMAQVFVLLLGEIDLSVGFNAACGATVTFWVLAIHHPWPTWLGIVAGLAFSAACAAFQGLIVVVLRIPSFVVTLAGYLGLSGILLYLFEKSGSVGLGGVISDTGFKSAFINDLVFGNIPPTVGWIALIVLIVVAAVFMISRDRRRRAHNLVAPPLSVTLLKIAVTAVIGVLLVAVLNVNRSRGATPLEGVPWVVPIILGLLVVTTVLLTRTRFGRYIYAIGGNAEAARRAGINLGRIRVLAFMCTGLMAGVTGILYASNLGSISTGFEGGQYVLYSVAGAVIGGVSLFGGRGRMLGAVLGGFVVAVIYNGVDLLGLGAAAQYIWTAVVLLAAVTLDSVARRGSATIR
jgi:D-xylose transport system permease protein